VIGSLAIAALLSGAPPVEVPKGEEPLVDVSAIEPRFVIDMRYATAENFFSQKVYPIATCALRKNVAEKMLKAQRWLDEKHRGHRLMFKDCYRPDRVQWVMWDAVKGTKKSGYVADPNSSTGSIHSYGAAVDVTLADKEGREVDMGTEHDHLGPLAEPRHEERFVKEGKLTAEQVEHRRILREAMIAAGMKMIPNEWWHFNDGSPRDVRRKYTRLDVPLESVAGKRP
jgi:zinc D-Ala-D-Ala dipeptidase